MEEEDRAKCYHQQELKQDNIFILSWNLCYGLFLKAQWCDGQDCSIVIYTLQSQNSFVSKPCWQF